MARSRGKAQQLERSFLARSGCIIRKAAAFAEQCDGAQILVFAIQPDRTWMFESTKDLGRKLEQNPPDDVFGPETVSSSKWIFPKPRRHRTNFPLSRQQSAIQARLPTAALATSSSFDSEAGPSSTRENVLREDTFTLRPSPPRSSLDCGQGAQPHAQLLMCVLLLVYISIETSEQSRKRRRID